MTAPFLTADDLQVRLAGREVLKGVSLALPQQGLIALVGPNGAGKTTLLRALAGLLPAHDLIRGTVKLDQTDIATLSIRERARRFAYLPQGHAVHWPLPVHDVVALGRYPHGATDPSRLSEADEAAVTRAMRTADVTLFSARSITELSGGERSRVALARVLAVEAPVILADEPIASLDPRHQIDVMRGLHAAAGDGKLVIVVTHDLGLAARFADQVLVLSNGQLAAQGSCDAALSDAVLAEVFRVDAYRAVHGGATVIVPWAERSQ
ncbi:ABC transporter ATP-binding protein [Bradyrhizobium sp. 2TAF24]|uniref:ABC transporter ATP-binding protein n=1 Tax=Bradyrhizobium sp. 2TAF24 TaxID=3233011 RepID=UPI003F8F107D